MFFMFVYVLYIINDIVKLCWLYDMLGSLRRNTIFNVCVNANQMILHCTHQPSLTTSVYILGMCAHICSILLTDGMQRISKSQLQMQWVLMPAVPIQLLTAPLHRGEWYFRGIFIQDNDLNSCELIWSIYLNNAHRWLGFQATLFGSYRHGRLP